MQCADANPRAHIDLQRLIHSLEILHVQPQDFEDAWTREEVVHRGNSRLVLLTQRLAERVHKLEAVFAFPIAAALKLRDEALAASCICHRLVDGKGCLGLLVSEADCNRVSEADCKRARHGKARQAHLHLAVCFLHSASCILAS